MIVTLGLLAIVILVLLNAFFVLAEFAMVKARPTQVETLVAGGDRRAKLVQYAQSHLDQFLSVCQVGITLASIGLGFVGEPALAALFKPVISWVGTGWATDVAAHSAAVGFAYLFVSVMHLVLGELVPKSIAIRATEKSALLVAYPMMFFHHVFRVPNWLLNWTVNRVLRLLRLPPVAGDTTHTEDEIRIILSRSQSGGVMSFRQLLYIENVLDMSALTVRNAMLALDHVTSLRVGMSREEIDRVIAEYRFSRYPLVGGDPGKPLGYIHIKDLYLAEQNGKAVHDLAALVRRCLATQEKAPLEQLLPDMQKRGSHLALVYDENRRWTGIITIEDAVEEVIGTTEKEFPQEPPVRLSDLLSPERIILDTAGDSIIDATRNALRRLAPGDLSVSMDEVMIHIAERERLVSSYVGRRLAVPHARLKRLTRPLVVVARLKTPIPAPVRGEAITLLFILLTPADTPRIHQILLSHIASMFSSEFLVDRLYDAPTPAELYSAICAAEQIISA